jgi:signal transduction histidine kinase
MDMRLADDVETSLYRIAQEALHNVVKHAGAQHLRCCCRAATITRCW